MFEVRRVTVLRCQRHLLRVSQRCTPEEGAAITVPSRMGPDEYPRSFARPQSDGSCTTVHQKSTIACTTRRKCANSSEVEQLSGARLKQCFRSGLHFR